jgi:hypothetical protein
VAHHTLAVFHIGLLQSLSSWFGNTGNGLRDGFQFAQDVQSGFLA